MRDGEAAQGGRGGTVRLGDQGGWGGTGRLGRDLAAGKTGRLGRDLAAGGDKAAGAGPDGLGRGRLGRDRAAGAGPDGWGRGRLGRDRAARVGPGGWGGQSGWGGTWRLGRDLAAGVQGGWGGTRRRGKGGMGLEGFCKVWNHVRGAVGSGPLDSELSKRGEMGPRRA